MKVKITRFLLSGKQSAFVETEDGKEFLMYLNDHHNFEENDYVNADNNIYTDMFGCEYLQETK